MAYLDVDAAYLAAKTPGDLKGRIEGALVRRAVTRIPAVVAADDQKELAAHRAIIDGSYPASWVKLMLSLLDTAAQLSSPTDAQLDTQAATALDRILKTRG
tara:strand:+ start:70 stop:372 length:303 start_codon:yes stop_codon:yes gene_type:complete